MLISTLYYCCSERDGPLTPAGDPQSLDGSLVDSDEQLTIVGSIALSSEMYLVVESDQSTYWRTDVTALYEEALSSVAAIRRDRPVRDRLRL